MTVSVLHNNALVAFLICLCAVLANDNGLKGSGVDRGCLGSLQLSLRTSFFEDVGIQCFHLLSLESSVPPGDYHFGPKAGCMTFEISCMSLYGSPSPAPLSDPVIDLTCPFDPLINRICSFKLLIDSGNGL